jgi:hypothetical protein
MWALNRSDMQAVIQLAFAPVFLLLAWIVGAWSYMHGTQREWGHMIGSGIVCLLLLSAAIGIGSEGLEKWGKL